MYCQTIVFLRDTTKSDMFFRMHLKHIVSIMSKRHQWKFQLACLPQNNGTQAQSVLSLDKTIQQVFKDNPQKQQLIIKFVFSHYPIYYCALFMNSFYLDQMIYQQRPNRDLQSFSISVATTLLTSLGKIRDLAIDKHEQIKPNLFNKINLIAISKPFQQSPEAQCKLQIKRGNNSQQLQKLYVQQLTCPLTLELFQIPTQTQCGHIFQGTALSDWMNKKKVCPLCRAPLEKIRVSVKLFRRLINLAYLSI